MRTASTTQIDYYKWPCHILLVVFGIGLIWVGLGGTAYWKSLWYWLDFRLWAWWVFVIVVLTVFVLSVRSRGGVGIVGILICGGMVLFRADFDIGVYEKGKMLAIRPGEGKVYDYRLYLPKGFHDFQGQHPLIVYLHGSGETGKDIEKLRGCNLRNYVKQELPAEGFPFIVVAPVTPKRPWEPDRVVAFIDDLTGQIGMRYNIDRNRIYLTGYSMGGFGTFRTACAYPDRFAAIVPVAGGGNPKEAAALQKVPTWAFHGSADKMVPYDSTKRMIDRMRKLEHPSVKFTTLKRHGHGIPKVVYSRPDLYQWLLQQKRGDRE